MDATLHLLGSPRRTQGDGSHEPLPLRRYAAILYYLALRGEWVGRDELTFLFWPDRDEASGRRNLRQLLHKARQQPWAEGVEIEAQRLRWRVATDVGALRASVEAGAWRRAAELPYAPLLERLSDPTAAGFEAWLELERSDVQGLWLTAVGNRAIALEEGGRPDEAFALHTAVLDREPLAEEVVQALLRCGTRAGLRREAAERYRTFVDLLERELGLEPLPDTRALAEASGASHGEAAPARSDLPHPPTPLVGRERELDELSERIGSADARLITVTGPGGIGKSRLALEAAHRTAERFGNGAAFVPLSPLDDPDDVPAAIAAGVGLPGFTGGDPREQLIDRLRDRTLLVLLDNAEHLPGVGALIADLSARAPGLTLLVTSRRQLALRGEWVLPLTGLDHPGPAPQPLESVAESASVRLLLQHAHRAVPGLRLTPETVGGVAEICRLLEGMPLALELTAVWLQVLSPDEIADRLRHDLDFLSSDADDLPERHRSLRAVFATSWRALSDGDRALYAALSVFRGGFDHGAAHAVAGATPQQLLRLLRASLLQRSLSGRFDLHRVLRQFAAQELERSGEGPQVRVRHRRRYARHLAEREGRLAGDDQVTALAEVRSEHDNVRQAWRSAIAARDVEALAEGVDGYYRLCYLDGDSREGAAAFTGALEALGERSDGAAEPLRARLLVYAAVMFQRLGERERVGDLAETALAAFVRLGDAAGATLSRTTLAHHRYLSGDHDGAEALYREALAGAEPGPRAGILNSLAILALHRGDDDGAEALLHDALLLAQRIGDERRIALVSVTLGNVLSDRGRYLEAERRYRDALDRYERLDSRYSQALTLNNLATVVRERGELDEAQALLKRTLTLSEELGDRLGVALAHHNLGTVAERGGDPLGARDAYLAALPRFETLASTYWLAVCHGRLAATLVRLDDPQGSRRHALAALTRADEVDRPYARAESLIACSAPLALVGHAGLAAELLSAISNHPEVGAELRRQAEGARERLAPAPGPATRDGAADLSQWTARALRALTEAAS